MRRSLLSCRASVASIGDHVEFSFGENAHAKHLCNLYRVKRHSIFRTKDSADYVTKLGEFRKESQDSLHDIFWCFSPYGLRSPEYGGLSDRKERVCFHGLFRMRGKIFFDTPAIL